jgi:hypothetical protein
MVCSTQYWRHQIRKRRSRRTTFSLPRPVSSRQPAHRNSRSMFWLRLCSTPMRSSSVPAAARHWRAARSFVSWASQLFDTPIRVSGAASFETERFTNGSGAAIDYIRPSARAQYINPENDQDYSPFLSYVPRLDFDPTFANNFATRQDLNLGIDKVFNFDGAFNRISPASNSSSETVWSFGFSIGGQRRFRDPSPQSYAFVLTRPRHTSSPSNGTPASRCR